MKSKIFKPRYYKHIDKIIDVKDVFDKITDPEYIKRHGFYPFISYNLEFKKFTKDHHRKVKERPIKYAAHIDRCIYQWYSYNLNIKYNEYCDVNNLNKTAIAYRTNLKGKTNIEFAKIAFDFIKKSGECYILVSDFSRFFDFIDHKILKKNLCEILSIENLSDDFYKVFRSMTKYSYIEKNRIENYLVSNKIETLESLKSNNCFFEKISWNKAKKDLKEHIKINKETYGIPQGSPLSGIFANVYMIEFDKVINEYAILNNGMYMRYSDDLIIIIPTSKVESIKKIWEKLCETKKLVPNLIMNIEKTSGYLYKNGKIISLHNEISNMKNGGSFISYLGFSFDGEYVKFRDKTLFKFFYKLYRKIDNMLEREKQRLIKSKKKHSKIDKHRILKDLNSSVGESRKFIDYVNRAAKVFSQEKYITGFRKNAKLKIFLRFENQKHAHNDDYSHKI